MVQPNRLVTTPIFGQLFDRLSFFASRITINLLFAAYVAAFFTGIRAVLAPLLAFVVVGVVPLPVIALTSALLMIISSAILIPEARAERRERLEMPVRIVAGD